MEVNFQNNFRASPRIDPSQEIKNHFELLAREIADDPFLEMKKRCVPTFTNEKECIKRTMFYLATFFPESDLQSPSFNNSPQFMNLLVDGNDVLLKLIFQISQRDISLPPGQFIVEVIEYFIPNKPILARKFVRFN